MRYEEKLPPGLDRRVGHHFFLEPALHQPREADDDQEQQDGAEHRAERDGEIADADAEREVFDGLEQIGRRDLPAAERKAEDDEDEQRTDDAGRELADEADAARLDAELTRELAPARRIGGERTID